MSNSTDGKLPCYNYGVHCLNPCVAECDLANGRGVQLYCRSCIENEDFEYSTDEDYEIDESLVFCEREWELQAK